MINSNRGAALIATCLSIGLLSACAQLPADPSQVAVAAEPQVVPCGMSLDKLLVRLTVHNRSKGQLAFSTNSTVGPPYALSWLSVKVRSGANGFKSTDWVHGGGGHGPMPFGTVTLHAGDTAQFIAALYEIQPADYQQEFQFELTDQAGVMLRSDRFRLCIPALTPS